MVGVARYIYTFITRRSFHEHERAHVRHSIIIFMMSLISEQICQMRFERRDRRAPLKLSGSGAKDDAPDPPRA